MSESAEPLLITLAEAKRRTGVHRPLDAAIARGEIPVVRAGAWKRVQMSDVLRHLGIEIGA